MSFLQNNESEYIAARVTNKGKEKIAQGSFVISYFQVGDSEFDYNFSEFDGTDIVTKPPQKVFTPLDKDSTIKYPYKLSESTVTGTTFGNPIQESQTETLVNKMGAAGFVSQYFETGSAIECESWVISVSTINGTGLTITGNDLTVGDFITIAFTELTTFDGLITGACTSLVYRIVASGATVTLDRPAPDLSAYVGNATIIKNKCAPTDSNLDCDANTVQGDPWTLNIVWGNKPAGLDVPILIDENLTGYTSNVFVSTKEFLGYTSSTGQYDNTGTTITNSFGEPIIVTPEEQHSLGIIHYSEIGTEEEPDKFFKYEDYIGHITEDDIDYFEIYIPFIQYHRNTGTTIGAIFHMDTVDNYVNSVASDTKLYRTKFRYLKDEQEFNVGKIFVGKKIIVFDDQEIIAALDYKSNRRYTLPIPRASQIAIGMKDDPAGNILTPLMTGSTGQTVFLTYLLSTTGTYPYSLPGRTGMHCNHYCKITGTTTNADVMFKFNGEEFRFMTNYKNQYTNGYLADRFWVLAQIVDTGDAPAPDAWKIIDFTGQIPNQEVGIFIDPANFSGATFVLTGQEYEDASRYSLEGYLGTLPDEPSTTTPEFGDEQPFPGSVKLVRATDVQVMRFVINMPDGEFTTTQNPTWSTGKAKKVTDVALLDSNKDVLVIGKTPKPITRVGTQVFVVKIDF